MKKIIGLCLVGFFAWADTALAQSPLEITLRPVITFDEPDRAVFEQCLFREVRNIPEAVIVDDKKHLVATELHVTIVSLGTGSQKTGYAAAVVAFEPLSDSTIKAIVPDAYQWLFAGTGYMTYNIIIADNSLASLCQHIVADWETNSVEPLRQFDRKLHAAHATAN